MTLVPDEFRGSPATTVSIKKVSCNKLVLLNLFFFLKIFHEEMALQWILTLGNSSTKNMILKNSWFFFEMMVS